LGKEQQNSGGYLFMLTSHSASDEVAIGGQRQQKNDWLVNGQCGQARPVKTDAQTYRCAVKGHKRPASFQQSTRVNG